MKLIRKKDIINHIYDDYIAGDKTIGECIEECEIHEIKEMRWASTLYTAETDDGKTMVGISCGICGKTTYVLLGMDLPMCCPWCGSREENHDKQG